jgi:dTDP-4-dehydrorhamnose reductase
VTRFLVTGAGGQLGADLMRILPAGDAVGVTRAELDVADPAAVEKVVADVRPDVVFNAAAYTKVDAAEEDEATAAAVNADGPANLARVCALHGGAVVHVSTDYVFAGDATRPYEPGDPVAPRSAYGRTKLAGEQELRRLLPERSWVVRTAWVYGESGPNFVRTMLKLEATRDTVDVVDDQRGSPTWSRDLAAALVALAGSDTPPGILHATNAGDTTWFGLARAIFAEAGADPDRVRPTTTDKFPRPAPRPPYSVLSDAAWRAAGLPPLRSWQNALHAALTEAPEAFRPV